MCLCCVCAVWKRVFVFISVSGVSVLFLLGLFMHALLKEIILQPNYTVIMEMRASCLEVQMQHADECVCLCVRDMLCQIFCMLSMQINFWFELMGVIKKDLAFLPFFLFLFDHLFSAPLTWFSVSVLSSIFCFSRSSLEPCLFFSSIFLFPVKQECVQRTSA